MKPLLGLSLGAVTLLIALPVLGQGTVNFANAAAGVNAPIVNVYGDPCEGAHYYAQLWARVDSSLQPVGDPVNFRTGGLAGYFLGGERVIPGVAPGEDAQVQVRVWSANYSSWASACDASTGGDPTAEVGWSGCQLGINHTFPVTTGGGVLPAGNLVNLQSFGMAWCPLPCIPEPSVFALGLLGALLVWGFRIPRATTKIVSRR